MSNPDAGWGKRVLAECVRASSDLNCTRQVQLLATRDGGGHWKPLDLPGVLQSSLQQDFLVGDKTAPSLDAVPLASADPDTQAFVGHGFDICQVPSLSQMQTWWNSSPYNAVNLYIGGSARACANSVLSASYLSQLNSQGWRFIPTWVGPQASCSGFSSRMSSNPVTAYNQGIAEADKALDVAANLGLTGADKSGTVIYYDLEAYNTGDDDCRAAADAFISGWVFEMHVFGNLGAAYAASCGSAPSDWASVANPPDALWVANWYAGAGNYSFDREASVWNAYCLSNSLWSNHQRLRQYAGDHNETWGGLTLGIDSNVLDGPVTVPNGAANLAAPSQPGILSPAAGTTLARTSDTWLAWKTTGDTCSMHVWGGSLDFTSDVNCTQYRLGVRTGGAYSWRVTATNAAGSTTGPVWHFNIRPYGAGSLSASAASSSQVNLSWVLSADEPSNVDSYLIFADGQQVGTVDQGVSSFQVKNLACNSLHTFYVTSVRQGVRSAPGRKASVTTPSCAPALSSPVEGALLPSLRPVFRWQPVADATGYRLQVSPAAGFSDLVIDRTLSKTSYSVPSDMPADTVFFWRVRSAGPFGDGDWSAAASFKTANPPSIPLLLSPAVDELLTDYTPLLDWADSTLPEGTVFARYQLQVAADSAFKTLVHNKSVKASQFTPLADLAADSRYYWRVRAVNSLGQYSSWSAKRSFRTAVLPPALASPLDGSSLPNLRPSLNWGDVAGATGYRLQVSITADFGTLLLSASPAASGYTFKSDLPADTLVYWRAQARATNGPSDWPAAYSFRTGNPPSSPSPLSPVGDVLVMDYTPLLDWSNSALPAGTTFDCYQVQVATDPLFKSLALNAKTAPGRRGASSFTPAKALAPNTTFYWRVRSLNTLGHYSAWSMKVSFRTAVSPPALIAPADGATSSQLRPTFDWSDVDAAGGYSLQVSRNALFTDLAADASPVSSTYSPAADLPANITLYWRVRTEAANGPSVWSTVYQFTVAP
jgi:hypothetical protein